MSEIESFTEIVMAISAIAVPIVIVWYYLQSKREIRKGKLRRRAHRK